MKSYFLDGLPDAAAARSALSRLLPHASDPWLLPDDKGDSIAYFTIGAPAAGHTRIQADLSGRHYDQGSRVLDILRTLQASLGGVVTDDDGAVL